jgi:hypothetical protein
LVIYASTADTTPSIEYQLSDINLLISKIIFTPKELNTSVKTYMKELQKKFIYKLERVAKIERGSYNTACQIIFSDRKVEPTVNGVTLKNEAIVICLPKVKTDALIKSFNDLLNKKYSDAMKNQEDQFKIPKMPHNYNMKVTYFTPFMIQGNKELKEMEQFYADLNENGISFNKKDV